MLEECVVNPCRKVEKALQHNDFFARSKVLHAEFGHAFENIEKRYMFLSRSFHPSVSDFSMIEGRISITKIIITVTQYYYIVIFTIPE